MNSIKPTIGRKVWFWDYGNGAYNLDQAFDATVIYVWRDAMVNLRVTDHNGSTSIQTSVQLRDPIPGDRHGMERVATWMPYQTAQAAKAVT